MVTSDQFYSVVVGLLTSIFSTILHIKGLVTGVAIEDTPLEIQTLVTETVTKINDATFGLAAIQAELATFQATTAIDVAAILAAVGAAQQTGSPVTLPITTPSGGSWLDEGNVGNDVWNFMPGYGPYSTGTLVAFAGDFAYTTGLGTTAPIAANPLFSRTPFLGDLTVPNITTLPALTLAGVPLGTSLLDALTAQNPAFTFGWYQTTGEFVQALSGPGGSYLPITSITDAEWQQLLANYIGVSATAVAPVWPGLANVTLGVPVSLVDGLVLTGPLSGVLVSITSVPAPISYYPFGSIKSYVRAGAVVFTEDNGDSEFPQPIGPESGLIMPTMMASAASATFRIPSGIVGTATPFTVA